ncbi:MAG: folate-binding protein [Alphaproteobacteria bacterium]|jgi:hypothetical protein|nr:folate-binding protein [Alphaproteobacteria bacterium]
MIKMDDEAYIVLEDRGVVLLEGAEACDFLQGLVSNDVTKAVGNTAVYAALLNPQGKYLHDFFVFPFADGLAIDCERERLLDLVRRLNIYRLRAEVTIADASDRFQVVALPGARSAPTLDHGAGALFADPRLAALGWRAVLPVDGAERLLSAAGFSRCDSEAFDALRLSLGVPDGSRDMVVDKAFLLESNFEELNGVDFDKGCYIGQENTARQKRRGTIRRRLMPVEINGPTPAPETPIRLGAVDVGTMRSSRDGQGMAMLRLEYVEKASQSGEPLVAGDTRLTPVKPDWARY